MYVRIYVCTLCSCNISQFHSTISIYELFINFCCCCFLCRYLCTICIYTSIHMCGKIARVSRLLSGISKRLFTCVWFWSLFMLHLSLSMPIIWSIWAKLCNTAEISKYSIAENNYFMSYLSTVCGNKRNRKITLNKLINFKIKKEKKNNLKTYINRPIEPYWKIIK